MTKSISNRKRVLFLFLTFISFLSLSAQSFSGKIISSQGGEPVPFANVMIKGTTTGVASDMDGKFAITIPSMQKNGTIIISAVGYVNKEMPVSEFNDKKVNIITISTQEYNIDEVDIQAESKVLYGAIKKCSQKISKNYIISPYSCIFDYTYNDKSASGQISDKSGYQRSSYKESFRNINYSFDKKEANTDNRPYFSGKTNMEDLLSFDLARTVGNVIDEQNVYDFDLSLVPQNDAQLWVIHFKAKKPSLYNTGEAHINTYEGELHILKDNFAVIKTVVRGKAEKRSIHGRSIAVNKQTSNYTTDHDYEVTTTYKQDGGKYRLDKIVMTESFTDKSGTAQKVTSALKIKAQKAAYVEISGRDYYVKSL